MRNDSEKDTIISMPGLADNLNIRKFLIMREDFHKIVKFQKKQPGENNPEDDDSYDEDDFDEYDSPGLYGLNTRLNQLKIIH
ncbi:MAG: hypothetical protein K0R14_2154 [Burkholderiales bacterium]|jgi:hypothetical protein|nr:hypothetical protein [Burkholderiales bacterium]